MLSEKVQGTFGDYVVVPHRNALALPKGLPPLAASVLGTAWLTAYRMLCVKSGLRPGQAMLVQGTTGVVSTALIQMGCAAGMEVWASSRSEEGRELARRLGACQAFAPGEVLPRRVEAVFDSGGPSPGNSLASVRRGGTRHYHGRDYARMVQFGPLPFIVINSPSRAPIMGTRRNARPMNLSSHGIAPRSRGVAQGRAGRRCGHVAQAAWRQDRLDALGRRRPVPVVPGRSPARAATRSRCAAGSTTWPRA